MADANLLECFPNPATDRDYLIEHTAEEFTSVCPKTGHPDFGEVVVRYMPDRLCVELKSLKLYLQSFRNDGIFYEAVTNKIADDLVAAMNPVWLELETHWGVRGGIRSSIRVEYGTPPGDADEDPRAHPGDDDEDDRLLMRPSDDDDSDGVEGRLPPGY